TQNTNLATQVQYAMSKDDAPYGTAPGAGMSNGQEIIAKTGTTNTAQSAFFIGAIPSQAMAVALFTDLQGDKTPEARSQTLNGQGGGQNGGQNGNPTPWPTYICDPQVVTCQPDNGGGGNQGVNGVPAGAGVGLVVTGLPLWARRRQRANGRRRLKGGPKAS